MILFQLSTRNRVIKMQRIMIDLSWNRKLSCYEQYDDIPCGINGVIKFIVYINHCFSEITKLSVQRYGI